jgi:predicted porin
MSLKKPAFALAALSLASAGAFAQTTVSLYGIVDAAVRVETNQGASRASVKSLIPGGMSQSRLGVNVAEDLGDGWRALVNLEHRLFSDTGAQANAVDFWRQAWVGLLTPAGRITVGRQYNVLFDLTTSTFAAYRYSPYNEAFKPELGMALTARQSNMVKYALTAGGFTAEAQVSAGEGVATQDKTVGGMARYQVGPFAVGVGYLVAKDIGNKQAKAQAIGASYNQGALYVNAAWAKNEFDAGLNSTLLAGYTAPFYSATTSPVALVSPAGFASVRDRDFWQVGFTYQLTPQFNIGAQYYNLKQGNYAFAALGIADRGTDASMYSVVGDYALSKRTDIYAGFDKVQVGSNSQATFANGARSRAGYMAGLRHRF